MADSNNAGMITGVFLSNKADTGSSPDPAAVLWQEWQTAHQETERLCRHQQRLEADLKSGAGEATGYAAALRAENEAGEHAIHLLELLSATPASSLAGAAAKLYAALGEGQPNQEEPEFPWPLIRSTLEDILRIGRLAEPPELFRDEMDRAASAEKWGAG